MQDQRGSRKSLQIQHCGDLSFGLFGPRHRTVVGDSAFSLMYTASACKQYRLYFMDIIKTANKEYPMATLKQSPEEQFRGNFKHMQATSTKD